MPGRDAKAYLTVVYEVIKIFSFFYADMIKDGHLFC